MYFSVNTSYKKDMNELIAPSHVKEYCCKDESDHYFRVVYDMFENENSFVYKLRCSCKNDRFYVYRDEHPGIYAECCNCGKQITVYDLKHYPAAVKLDDNCQLSRVHYEPVSVFMNYEYSDEYLYEDDVAFDINDVVWGKVFISVNNSLIKILDDETA